VFVDKCQVLRGRETNKFKIKFNIKNILQKLKNISDYFGKRGGLFPTGS